MNVPITGEPGSEEEERNRRLVLDFGETVMLRQQFDHWAEYLSPNYIQHKPGVANGPQGLISFVKEDPAHDPGGVHEIVRSFVDGDYVILHLRIRREPADRDLAVIDIFRVEDGKLAEHWDVEQPVPHGADGDRMF